MEAVAITGGATVMSVAVFFWLMARSIRDAERRAAHWEVEALVARAQVTVLEQQAKYSKEALEKRDAAYTALNQQYLKLARDVVSRVDDATAVTLAGGDSGDLPGPGLVDADRPDRPVGDGLLSPWDETDPSGNGA